MCHTILRQAWNQADRACSKSSPMSHRPGKVSLCENGPSRLLLSDQVDKRFLLRSSTKLRTNYTLHLRNPLEVTPLPPKRQLTYFQAFKKPPFKLEEQGWGEFDMAITLHFAEKSGTKELAHDLHFQAPKYETTHVVVRLALTSVFIDFVLGIPQTFTGSS